VTIQAEALVSPTTISRTRPRLFPAALVARSFFYSMTPSFLKNSSRCFYGVRYVLTRTDFFLFSLCFPHLVYSDIIFYFLAFFSPIEFNLFAFFFSPGSITPPQPPLWFALSTQISGLLSHNFLFTYSKDLSPSSCLFGHVLASLFSPLMVFMSSRSSTGDVSRQ